MNPVIDDPGDVALIFVFISIIYLSILKLMDVAFKDDTLPVFHGFMMSILGTSFKGIIFSATIFLTGCIGMYYSYAELSGEVFLFFMFSIVNLLLGSNTLMYAFISWMEEKFPKLS